MRRARRITTAAATVAVCTVLVGACAVGTSDDDDTETQGASDASASSTGPEGDATVDSSQPPDESADENADESAEENPALLMIMDASGSMKSRDAEGQPLIDGAKQALRDLVGELPDEQHVGLRVYGHTYPNTDEENGCTDTELIHPVEELDREALLGAIDGYDAKGFTPIGLSLEESAGDLPPEGPRTIVLVSDGLETCDTDPCAVAEDLAADGIEVVINTVGFALDEAGSAGDADEARDQLSCIAEAGNGTFTDVESAADLADTLEEMSRDERTVEVTGDTLEGELLTSRANTGEVNTTYSDTIVSTEVLYYRFEVPQGSEVEAEVIQLGEPKGQCRNISPTLDLVDAGGTTTYEDTWGGSIPGGSHPETLNHTMLTDPVVIDDADEAFIMVRATRNECDTEVEFDLEIELRVLD